MGRIYNLPTLEIICRGDDNIDISDASGQTGSVHHVEVKPKVQSESINIDLSGLTFESVAIEDGTDLGEHTLQWITTSMSNQTWSTVQNRTLTCDDSIKDTYMTELRFLVSKGYNISGVQQPVITGLEITTYMRPLSEFGEFNITAEVTGPSGAVYDLQWTATSDIPVSGMSIVKTGALTSKFIFRPETIDVYNENVFAITVTDTISGLTADIWFKDSIYPRASISGPSSITDSGTYQYTGYKNVNDNVLGPQSEVASGNNVSFSLSNAPSGVTIDSSTGVLTVPDNIDSTFSVQVRIEFNVGYIYDTNASMSVTANTVVQHSLQSLEIYGLASTIYTGSNSYPFKIYFTPSDADINSLVGNVVGVTPSDYSDMQYNIGTTKHTDAHGSYVDASISYTDLTKEGQLQVYVFDPNTGNRDDVYITSEAPLPASLTSLSIENVPIIETDPGTQRYSFRIYIDPQNGDLSNLVWDNYYTVMFRSSRSSYDTTVQFDGTRYYIDAWIEFENLSSTGQIGLVIKDSFNPSVYSEYVVTVIQ